MSLDLGHDDRGGNLCRLVAEYRFQILLMALVFVASFAITMFATMEPTKRIVIRHGIKDGVQFAERWCRTSTIWSASEAPAITHPDGTVSC